MEPANGKFYWLPFTTLTVVCELLFTSILQCRLGWKKTVSRLDQGPASICSRFCIPWFSLICVSMVDVSWWSDLFKLYVGMLSWCLLDGILDGICSIDFHTSLSNQYTIFLRQKQNNQKVDHSFARLKEHLHVSSPLAAPTGAPAESHVEGSWVTRRTTTWTLIWLWNLEKMMKNFKQLLFRKGNLPWTYHDLPGMETSPLSKTTWHGSFGWSI